MTAALPVDPAGDPQYLLDRLVDGLERAVPAGADGIEVERDRSLGDRLSGRPGRAASLRITRGDSAMTLRLDGRRLLGESARVVGGVIISRRTLPLGEWLTTFAGQVAALAADVAGDAAAAATALSVLGVQPAGADLVIADHDVDGGLRALPARVAGRLPDEAVAAVTRIAELLRDTLPRVLGSTQEEVLVRRTATVYLPDTLRAYVALPADWAATHRLSNGLTASDALSAQLADLEAAAQRMRDAAVEQDANALLVNGRFLADRFAISSLDLP